MHDLENGFIDETVRLPWSWQIGRLAYNMVWNDMVLDEDKKFLHYVHHHGMSTSEPVDIMLVSVGWPEQREWSRPGVRCRVYPH